MSLILLPLSSSCWAVVISNSQADLRQPSGLNTRSVLPGYLASLSAGLLGRATNSPPQLGQRPLSFVSAHDAQKVHSNEQTRASVASGGRSLLQHSQFGLSSSMVLLLRRLSINIAHPLTRKTWYR